MRQRGFSVQHCLPFIGKSVFLFLNRNESHTETEYTEHTRAYRSVTTALGRRRRCVVGRSIVLTNEISGIPR